MEGFMDVTSAVTVICSAQFPCSETLSAFQLIPHDYEV